jgi:hypothetical protein
MEHATYNKMLKTSNTLSHIINACNFGLRTNGLQIYMNCSRYHCISQEWALKLASSGVYSSQTLYGVVNFRGVTPNFLPAVWKLNVPPRIQFFLWLVSQNKILTRDNLGKRRNVDDPTCLFCKEPESVDHLLFGCVVASRTWELVSQVVGVDMGSGYELVASLWLCNKKFGITK